MTPPAQALREDRPSLDSAKFRDPLRTAAGQARARIGLRALETLWFNTGTLCNLACGNCYIESSPANDRLSYLTAAEVGGFLDEIARESLPVRTVGLTGGEPFMNPEIADILERILAAGHEALVLTNAMRPMTRHAGALRALRDRFGARLTLRVSIDHYAEALHALERGPRAWAPMILGLKFLSDNGFAVTAAGRTMWKESEAELRAGYARLFERENIRIDANDPAALLLFPEMDESLDVPEITEACWDILGVDPGSLMCASSRMVVKRKGESRPVVMPCTLLPYDERFVMGHALGEAAGAVALNHPHCARFCVLGGGSCSG